MSYFRITLIRSAIGLPTKIRGVLNALGLRKRTAVVYHPVNTAVAGQILKIKELVSVSEVAERKTREQEREGRRGERGWVVESQGLGASSIDSAADSSSV